MQMKCKNNICKAKFWMCDGVDDCGDNSDEDGCGEEFLWTDASGPLSLQNWNSRRSGSGSGASSEFSVSSSLQGNAAPQSSPAGTAAASPTRCDVTAEMTAATPPTSPPARNVRTPELGQNQFRIRPELDQLCPGFGLSGVKLITTEVLLQGSSIVLGRTRTRTRSANRSRPSSPASPDLSRLHFPQCISGCQCHL